MPIDSAWIAGAVVLGILVAAPPALLVFALLRRNARRYGEAEDFAILALAFARVYLAVAILAASAQLIAGHWFWEEPEPWTGPLYGYPVALWFYARLVAASIRTQLTQDMRRLWRLREEELPRLPTAPAADAGPAAPG
jgi:hypothetical protein